MSPAPALAVIGTAPSARSRVIAFFAILAVAVSLLVTPQFTSAAIASTAKPPLNTATAAKWAHNMVSVINYERRLHHLRPVKMNSKLIASAHRHNLTMAKKNTMSHQLPGEAFFATRISRAGYNWQAAGENIGWNSNQSNRGLQLLEHQMYKEKAPNNGHKLNILSRSFRQVGIDVYFDKAHHKMWFTQDFGQPA
jgi:uncharacterized protein YkwD